MIFAITVVAMLLLSATFSYKYKDSFYNTLPLSLVITMLVLYVLAFFRGMRLIGVLSVLFIAALGICFYLKTCVLASKGVGRRDVAKNKLKEFFSMIPGAELAAFALFLFAVRLLTGDMVFNWWDDINFWSSDAKQLFYLGGFPGKYGNVSPEFGDYPPAGSLIKWLFLQISPGEYDESIQFFGYFTMNLIFLLPLYGAVKRGINKMIAQRVVRYAFCVITFLAIVLFPGVFSGIIYYGTPADVTMAIVYGALLYMILEGDVSGPFYYVRIFLMTSMLLLTKSVGIEWAIFALVFYFIMKRKSGIRGIVLTVLGSGAVYGSWLLFCLLNRRVAKLTGAGIKMATSGTYEAPANALDKAKFFTQGFWTMPIHADSNLSLDISTGVVVILIFAAIVVLGTTKIIKKKEAVKLAIFMAVTALLTYGIIFLAHISIFMTEDQYLDAFAMSISISRYGCPFALGGVYLLMCMYYEGKAGANRAGQSASASSDSDSGSRFSAIRTCLATSAFAIFVFLTANYVGFFGYLFDHKQAMEENAAYVDEMVGEDGKALAETVFANKELWGKRVLVMRDGHTYHWVHNAYISGKASPVALVYDGFIAEEDSAEAMARKIAESHASYLYIEDDEMLSKDLFTPLLKEGADFESRKVYSITYVNGGVLLE
ncbi:hypothetical protein D6853_07580 [Butyrivibrio sp. X503]|uniref:hypothetical protein n=1 Tax=Butyrivibrio sp. X503 TaxID=2364878 RepID=UPI000EA99F5B|nr:hypothetical protein [Butyrivibrio sp. X503]RKM56631.1 hypothetical protein D6853_07580 [Butyrivibrio sp. X503]